MNHGPAVIAVQGDLVVQNLPLTCSSIICTYSYYYTLEQIPQLVTFQDVFFLLATKEASK